MNDEQFKELINKLEILSKLMGLSLVQGKPLKEQVRILYKAGLTPTQIAAHLGTTKNNISQYIYRKKIDVFNLR
ncbi:MAG: hypothetical protein ACREBB_01720 [Nitrosotalea sp.]